MWTSLFHALRGRCPNCGIGKLFSGYIRTVERCTHCGEALGHIRADDGPPWLTILIVGHILLPVIFSVGPHAPLPDSWMMPLWLLAACLLMALILPRAKGIFIAFLWRQAAAKPASPEK